MEPGWDRAPFLSTTKLDGFIEAQILGPSATPPQRTMCFSPWAQRILLGEVPSREHSIQAGSLCYNNRCAVELIVRLDASSKPPARRRCLVRARRFLGSSQRQSAGLVPLPTSGQKNRTSPNSDVLHSATPELLFLLIKLLQPMQEFLVVCRFANHGVQLFDAIVV